MKKTKKALKGNRHIGSEFLSDWFIDGLQEFGISEKEYHAMSQKDKNEVRKSLAEFGHF